MPRTSVEIAAYSVEEAIRLALEELQLTIEDVEIDILSDAGPDEDDEALVRVTARGHASQPTPSAPAKPAPRDRGGDHGGRRDRGERGNGGGGNRLSGRRGPGDRPSQRGTPPTHTVDRTREPSPDETVAIEILSTLLGHMDIEAEVVAVANPSHVTNESDQQTIFLDVLGHDLGMLIGRRGDHLSQIQYLTTMLLNRKIGTWTRVIVDVEGYRNRREESLVGLAERVARQVSRSQRPIELEPMPPNERRIIHLTLQDHPDVTTESTGEGNGRRISVLPRPQA